jgi:hypothetical protein
MALRSEMIAIIVQYCPPHIPLRAASPEMLKLTELCEPFMEYFENRHFLAIMESWDEPTLPSKPYQLSRAVRFGHSTVVNLLMRFNTDPNIPVSWLDHDSDDGEIVVEETPFETAMRTGNWDAVVAFVSRGFPCKLSNLSPSTSLRGLPWNRLEKQVRAYFQRLKEDNYHQHVIKKRARELDWRAREDARRRVEDVRRAKEDARHARCELRRAHMMAKRQQREVEMPGEDDDDREDEEQLEPKAMDESETTNRQQREVEVPERDDEDHEDEEQPGPKAMDASETAKFLAAIQASRADLPVLSGDNVMLLRITRMARSPLVARVLLESELLLQCRERVLHAGCEIAPRGACGPKLFVPCTAVQLEELKEAGFELLDHHILALRGDKALINQAFKDALPKKQRPTVSSEHGSAADHAIQASEGYTYSKNEDDDAMDFVIEESGYATDSDIGFPAY